MTTSAVRYAYLDWVRGLAVLIMIEAHVVDSWTRAADRSRPMFGYAMILGGFGAPLFLFLAGVAVVLSAESKFRRTRDFGACDRRAHADCPHDPAVELAARPGRVVLPAVARPHQLHTVTMGGGSSLRERQ
jgi:hypothetical protein